MAQVRVDVVQLLPIEDLLTIQVDFEPAIRPRGEGDSNVFPKSPKEFVGHPRGRGVVLSRDAIHDVHENLPFSVSHLYPPSCDLQSHTTSERWYRTRCYCTRFSEDVKARNFLLYVSATGVCARAHLLRLLAPWL